MTKYIFKLESFFTDSIYLADTEFDLRGSSNPLGRPRSRKSDFDFLVAMRSDREDTLFIRTCFGRGAASGVAGGEAFVSGSTRRPSGKTTELVFGVRPTTVVLRGDVGVRIWETVLLGS